LTKRAKHESGPEIDITPEHPIWEAWIRMIEYYGSAFTFGEAPSATWIYHLQDLTAEQIGQGIRNLPRHESAFPPNPGEFKDLCLNDHDWEHKRLKYVHPDTLLERKRTAEENQQGLANIREIMGKL
jgi:hypothetical protein